MWLKKMCDKVITTHSSTTTYVPDRFKTQEMCDKVVDRYFFVFDSVPDQPKTQEMFDRFVSEESYLIVYCPDRYKTDASASYADETIIYFNKNFGAVKFCCNEMGILSADVNDVDLEDSNYDESDPETIFHVRILAWHSKLEKRKALKKELNEKLMLITWHSRR